MAHPGRSPSRQDQPDPDLQLERPNSARMYDYYLGGPANFAVDREAAEQAPFVGVWARENRSFSGRAVRHLCEQGIDQFLDLGSGVPTIGNVHEIVHHANPTARVAYVDYEPVAVNHARRLLAGTERVTVTQADIREPAQVLAAPGVAGLLDFTRPIAVLAVAILHFIPDTHEPAQILAGYRQACMPGSYLLISHVSEPDIRAELGEHRFQALHEAYRRTPPRCSYAHRSALPRCWPATNSSHRAWSRSTNGDPTTPPTPSPPVPTASSATCPTHRHRSSVARGVGC